MPKRIKESEKSFLFTLLNSSSSFGDKSYLIYIFIYLILSTIILSKVNYFPDYANYDQYIINGTGSLRFRFEPINAFLMSIMNNLNFSAKEYYLLIWIISSFFLFLIPFIYGRRYFIFSIFLLLNPINIIMFQTPRQFLAYSFFVFALMLSMKIKVLFLVFAILSHTISGFLSLFIVSLMQFKKILFSISLLFGLILLVYFTSYIYTVYSSDEIQRGIGRLVLFSIFILVTLFIGYKKDIKEIFALISILLFVLLSYQITPYAGRILPFFLPIILLYLFNSFKKRDSIFLIHTLLLSYLIISTTIIISGRFGYG
jgi:hypothetical protein